MYKTHETDAARHVVNNVTPSGYKLLIALPIVEEQTKGGIFLTQDMLKREHVASIIGTVVAMGPSCYHGVDRNGIARFPDGAWCHVGDNVIFKSYAGVRISYEDQEFRLINDDSIEAVVKSPVGIERAI